MKLTKKTYLPFHAHNIWQVMEKLGLPLLMKKEEITTSVTNKYNPENVIKTEQELIQILETKPKFSVLLKACIKTNYIENVFSLGHKEQKEYFLNQYKNYFSSFSLKDMNNLMPSLNINDIIDCLTKSSDDFAKFEHEQINQTAKLLSTQKSGAEILMVYLTRKNPSNQENIQTSIREAIIEHFPHEVHIFKALPVIKNYFELQQKSIFNHVESITQIKINLNCEVIQNRYPIKNLDEMYEYGNMLECFMDNLGQMSEYGIKSTSEESVGLQDDKKIFYVNLSKESFFNEAILLKIVENYCSYSSTTNPSENGFADHSREWLKTAMFSEKLDASLPTHQIKKKSAKI